MLLDIDPACFDAMEAFYLISRNIDPATCKLVLSAEINGELKHVVTCSIIDPEIIEVIQNNTLAVIAGLLEKRPKRPIGTGLLTGK